MPVKSLFDSMLPFVIETSPGLCNFYLDMLLSHVRLCRLLKTPRTTEQRLVSEGRSRQRLTCVSELHG